MNTASLNLNKEICDYIKYCICDIIYYVDTCEGEENCIEFCVEFLRKGTNWKTHA